MLQHNTTFKFNPYYAEIVFILPPIADSQPEDFPSLPNTMVHEIGLYITQKYLKIINLPLSSVYYSLRDYDSIYIFVQ